MSSQTLLCDTGDENEEDKTPSVKKKKGEKQGCGIDQATHSPADIPR